MTKPLLGEIRASVIDIRERLIRVEGFAIALTKRVDGELGTSDHHELDAAAAAGDSERDQVVSMRRRRH
jgi:hypothetical protein